MIQQGDMVQLIFACCYRGRRHIGWTGVVEGLIDDTALGEQGGLCYCGVTTHGMHACVDIEGKGWVPLSWLIKIEPPGEKIEVTREEEFQ